MRAPSRRPSPSSPRMISPRWCRLMTRSRRPWPTRFAIPYSRIGNPHTGSIGLGRSAPTRPSRVDRPAHRSIARTRAAYTRDMRIDSLDHAQLAEAELVLADACAFDRATEVAEEKLFGEGPVLAPPAAGAAMTAPA